MYVVHDMALDTILILHKLRYSSVNDAIGLVVFYTMLLQVKHHPLDGHPDKQKVSALHQWRYRFMWMRGSHALAIPEWYEGRHYFALNGTQNYA